MTTVEEFERMVNRNLRRWLGVPPGLTSIALYGKSADLQLPFSSVTEEFKVAKCRLVMTLRDPQDRMIPEAGIQTRSAKNGQHQ